VFGGCVHSKKTAARVGNPRHLPSLSYVGFDANRLRTAIMRPAQRGDDKNHTSEGGRRLKMPSADKRAFTGYCFSDLRTRRDSARQTLPETTQQQIAFDSVKLPKPHGECLLWELAGIFDKYLQPGR
jgi:hypothetical protein